MLIFRDLLTDLLTDDLTDNTKSFRKLSLNLKILQKSNDLTMIDTKAACISESNYSQKWNITLTRLICGSEQAYNLISK